MFAVKFTDGYYNNSGSLWSDTPTPGHNLGSHTAMASTPADKNQLALAAPNRGSRTRS